MHICIYTLILCKHIMRTSTGKHTHTLMPTHKNRHALTRMHSHVCMHNDPYTCNMCNNPVVSAYIHMSMPHSSYAYEWSCYAFPGNSAPSQTIVFMLQMFIRLHHFVVPCMGPGHGIPGLPMRPRNLRWVQVSPVCAKMVN